MKIRTKISAAVLALLAIATLLVASTPASATAGCRVYSPWAAYPLTGSSVVMTTNRFIAERCSTGSAVDIDLNLIESEGGAGQCAYFRVELFDSAGHSTGAWTVDGPWTWKWFCNGVDGSDIQLLLDDVVVGTKYDIQEWVTTIRAPAALWLGYVRD
jgi:hypothetical protein